MAGGESPPRSTPLGSARPCGVGPGANGAGAPGPSRAVPSRAGGGGSGSSSSMGLELYLDLLSQPCRALYIFARTNNIPFEFKHVELMKGERWRRGKPPGNPPGTPRGVLGRVCASCKRELNGKGNCAGGSSPCPPGAAATPACCIGSCCPWHSS